MLFGIYRKKETGKNSNEQNMLQNEKIDPPNVDLSCPKNWEFQTQEGKDLNSCPAQRQNLFREITPTKSNANKDQDDPIQIDTATDSVLSIILRGLLCLLLPFLFPTVVYSTEGYCPLFWQATAASTTVTLILLLVLIIAFSNRTRWMRDAICKTIPVKVKIMFEDGQEIRYFLAKLIGLIAVAVCGGYAHQRSLWNIFYACLVLTGFLLGLVSNQVYSQLLSATQNRLPIASPCRVRVSVTKSSPTPSSRRQLNFSGKVDRSPIIPLHIPNPTTPGKYVLLPNSASPGRSPAIAAEGGIQSLFSRSYSLFYN